MARIAGVDSAAGGGWAVVILDEEQPEIRRIKFLEHILDGRDFDIISVDIPIGLLDAYEIGGRLCDRDARVMLGKKGSSVFPAPVRAVLTAASYDDAKALSRASSSHYKAITKQTFAIVPKIKEIDDLLQKRPKLLSVIREIHPEVCFCKLTGMPMNHSKKRPAGRTERRQALTRSFSWLDWIEKAGRDQGLAVDDILDAAVACWSAQRLAGGRGHSLPANVPYDSKGLPMAIWV